MKIKNLKRHKRRALLAANFLHVFGWALHIPLYALFVSELGGSPQTAALAWSFYTLLGGVLIIALGWVEDHLQQKEKVLALGYVLQTFGTILLFAASDLNLVIAGYGVYAVGTGLVVPVWKQVFSRVEVKNREATEWGIFNGGNMLLISAAAALSSVLYGVYGFKGILGLMVFTHVLSAAIGIRIARRAARYQQ